MLSVVHRVGQVDGGITTYWHHVMQLMVIISDFVFQAQDKYGSNVQIVMLSNDPAQLSLYVQKYNWIPQLGKPIKYQNSSFVMTDPYVVTTRRCDPLQQPLSYNTISHCETVHTKIRTLLISKLGLKHEHDKISMLVVREALKLRTVSNLGEMIRESALYALRHQYSFHSIMLENMPLQKQLQWFYNADHIVIARGSATANLLICRPSTHVVLASSPDKWVPTFWIPFQYKLSLALVQGENFDKTVTLDVNSLTRALRHSLPNASGL